MKILKKIFRLILVLIFLLALGFVGIIVYAIISDYKPEEKITLFNSDSPDRLPDTAGISLITWNIGYCGLDKEMDFFYDGGTKVITPEAKYIENLDAVEKFLSQNDTVDFILIQEIDKNSKRSYKIDQFEKFGKLLNEFHPFFATNYEVFFVPVPPASPMGKVLSGVATFSRYQPSSSTRYQFPGKYGFPKQLFMLDRCFLLTRYPLEDGKELLVINTHNEAFDPGQIRKAQMAYLKQLLLSEYEKGNYVITGGDWNMSPPGFVPEFSINKVNTDQMAMDSDFLPPEWKWVYDSKVPSNRSVIAGYDPSTTTTTVIDVFLLSPNIKNVSVECINLDFENSDHNPVRIKVELQK
ncbi:MAG: endonuclease/exonuclease/phosphatase family protein [Bacteroidia bacterium]|nr:MAG: endonuclease/exonuclease/phosphatase family protein [Bacteroidia bacterium]